MRAGAFLFRHAPGMRQTVNRGERDLLLLRVFARGLPERLRRLLDIENVVDDLESQPDVLSVAGKRGVLGGVGSRVDGAHAETGAQQGAGLGAMYGFEQLLVRRLSFAFEIRHLPA